MKAEDWASLSSGGRQLLGKLQQGGALAVPSVYPGALTFSDQDRSRDRSRAMINVLFDAEDRSRAMINVLFDAGA